MKDKLLKDPLHEILEHHLYRSTTEGDDAQYLLNAIISDYTRYLESQGVHIPSPLRQAFFEDLKEEIRDQVLKKTHGAISIDLKYSELNLNLPKINRRTT